MITASYSSAGANQSFSATCLLKYLSNRKNTPRPLGGTLFGERGSLRGICRCWQFVLVWSNQANHRQWELYSYVIETSQNIADDWSDSTLFARDANIGIYREATLFRKRGYRPTGGGCFSSQTSTQLG